MKLYNLEVADDETLRTWIDATHGAAEEIRAGLALAATHPPVFPVWNRERQPPGVLPGESIVPRTEEAWRRACQQLSDRADRLMEISAWFAGARAVAGVDEPTDEAGG